MKCFIFTLSFIFSSVLFSQWINVSTNLAEFQSLCFLNQNTGFVLDISFHVYKTTNSGINWQIVPNGFIWDVDEINFVNENTGFVCGDYNRIFKTTNSGLNWIADTITGQGYQYFYSLFFLNPNTGFCCGGRSILKTTNSGNNWVLKYVTYQSEPMSIYFSDSNTGYCTGDGKVYKSTNSGENWQIIRYDSLSPFFTSVFFTNNLTGFIGGHSSIILKTTNGGINWIGYNTNLNPYIEKIFFSSKDTGYAVGHYGTLLKTINGGINWYSQYNQTTDHLMDVQMLNNNTGFAAGYNGIILKTSNGGGPIGIKQLSTEVPEKYQLQQNYPNPFNPTTKIKIDVSKVSMIVIKVYNILGEEISTLVNKELKPGTYEVELGASNYPSGTYFYRLQTPDFIETKKMVLLK